MNSFNHCMPHINLCGFTASNPFTTLLGAPARHPPGVFVYDGLLLALDGGIQGERLFHNIPEYVVFLANANMPEYAAVKETTEEK